MDWQTCADEREKYQLYLCSREWAEKRNAVRKRCGGICERCFIHPMYAVHHLTYARKYAELTEDLQGLCTFCHEFTHGHGDHDPLASDFKRIVTCVLADVASRIADKLSPSPQIRDAWISLLDDMETSLNTWELSHHDMPEFWALSEKIAKDLNLPGVD